MHYLHTCSNVLNFVASGPSEEVHYKFLDMIRDKGNEEIQ